MGYWSPNKVHGLMTNKNQKYISRIQDECIFIQKKTYKIHLILTYLVLHIKKLQHYFNFFPRQFLSFLKTKNQDISYNVELFYSAHALAVHSKTINCFLMSHCSCNVFNLFFIFSCLFFIINTVLNWNSWISFSLISIILLNQLADSDGKQSS